MIVIATKFSHKIGYGHIFRCLNIIDKFGKNKCLLLINDKNKIENFLKKVNFQVVNFKKNNWEDEIIKKFEIKIWINDRLNTTKSHVTKLKKNSIYSIGIDDDGSGKNIYNLNIAQNINIQKKNRNKGINNKKLLILKEVKKQNIFIRKKIKKIMLTFGGSDTYSITNKILKKLYSTNFNVTAYYGPGYKNKIKNKNSKNINFNINTKNLENEMVKYDLIICGGGITPLNAASQGLPSLIVACEKHEIKTAKYLNILGISNYLGFRKFDKKKFNFEKLNIERMSKNCLRHFQNTSTRNFVNFVKRRYNDHRK